MAQIAVRLHGFVGAGLLALSAPLALLAAFRINIFDADVHILALLGGVTLLAQATTLWYLPSFAKRGVVLDGMASYSGPLLFPAAVLGAAVGSNAFRTALPSLGMILFGIILLGSALAGPVWRGGTPFWRVDGPHRRTDRLAAGALASGAIWLALGGALGALDPRTIVLSWPAGLALLALGALTHLLPRGSGRAPIMPLHILGLAAFQTGMLLLVAERHWRTLAPPSLTRALLFGLALAALSLALARPTKSAGPRGREAAPFLAAALPLAFLFPALVLAGRTPAYVLSSYYVALTTVVLAWSAVAVLSLPVVFNQRPAARWFGPSALAAGVGAPLLVAGLLTALPRWPGAIVLAGALILLLAGLAPLRKPRRECPEPS